jgi:hypothetical protein
MVALLLDPFRPGAGIQHSETIGEYTMEPTTIILGVLVAIQTAYTSWIKFRGTRATATASAGVDMAELIDSRIRFELDRQDEEIRELKKRVLHLEKVESEHIVAQIYMRANGLPWPIQPEVA